MKKSPHNIVKGVKIDAFDAPVSAAEDIANTANLTTDANVEQPTVINLLELVEKPSASTVPEIIRIGDSEKAVIPFTPHATPITAHYCDEAEIRSYVHCAGDDCLLCRVGKKATNHSLLPVVVPVERRVGLLMIGAGMRPGSLLYQILPHLKADGPRVVFIAREGSVFRVAGRDLRTGEDAHAGVISQFLKLLELRKVDLRQAVLTLNNEQILAVGSIREMLMLKGGLET